MTRRLTRTLTIAACAMATRASAQNVEPVLTGVNGRDQFRLAWSDEFNGTSLDATKWGHEFTGKRWDALTTPDAVSVTGGNLLIKTYSAPYAGALGQQHYTGAISTRDTFSQAYGYFESRIDFNGAPGTWSAFWVQSPKMTSNIPADKLNRPDLIGSEIDVVEYRAFDKTNTDISASSSSAVHWNGYEPNGVSNGSLDYRHNAGVGYHVFGVLWARDRYEFYVDGDKTLTVNDPMAVSSLAQFLILSSEVRYNNWASNPPAAGYGTLASTAAVMKVDYVRVFNFNQDSGEIITPEPAATLTALSAASLLARRGRRGADRPRRR